MVRGDGGEVGTVPGLGIGMPLAVVQEYIARAGGAVGAISVTNRPVGVSRCRDSAC